MPLSQGLIIGILTVLLTTAPGYGHPERFQEALKLLQEGELDAGQRLLEELLREAPDQALYLFNLANIYFLREQYHEAGVFYEKVQQQDTPLRVPATLYRAACYEKNGELQKAEASLDSLAQVALPPNLSQEYKDRRENLGLHARDQLLEATRNGDYETALRLIPIARRTLDDERLARLQQDLARRLEGLKSAEPISLDEWESDSDSVSPARSRAYDGEIIVEGGYASNIYADPKGSAIASAMMNLEASGAYTLPLAADWDARLLAATKASLAAADSQYRFSSSELGFSFGAWVPSDFYISLIPKLSIETVGTHVAWRSAEFTLRVESRLESNYAPGLQYRGLVRKPIDPDYDYVQGQSQNLDLYLQLIRDNLYVLPYLSWEQDGSQDLNASNYRLPLAYSGPILGLSASYRWGEDWKGTVNSSLALRNYRNMAWPDSVQRRDRLAFLSLQGSRQLAAKLQLYAKLSLLWNRSSLGSTSFVADKNYQQTTASIGVAWDL